MYEQAGVGGQGDSEGSGFFLAFCGQKHFAKLERLLGHGSHENLEDGRLLYQLKFFLLY